jgi:hypothetical protein
MADTAAHLVARVFPEVPARQWVLSVPFGLRYFHALALDGIYVEGARGKLVFRHVPPPSEAEVARVADRVRRSVARLMERRGMGRMPVQMRIR